MNVKAALRKLRLGQSIKIEALPAPRLSVDQSLKVLELDRSKLGDAQAIKDAYRKAAMKNHPDRGGSAEKMKDVNEAYEVLTKPAGSYSAPPPNRGYKYQQYHQQNTPPPQGPSKERKAEFYRMAEAWIISGLKRFFDKDSYTTWLKMQTGLPLEVVKYAFSNDMMMRTGEPTWAGLSVKWMTPDKNTRISLDFVSPLYELKVPERDDYVESYNMGFIVEIFHNNKKTKLYIANQSDKQLQAFLARPDNLFSQRKMKSIFAPRAKKGTFGKKEMKLGLEQKLDARVVGASTMWAKIPLGAPADKIGKTASMFEFSMYRKIAMTGPALWALYEVATTVPPYEKAQLKYEEAAESVTLLNALVDLQKRVHTDTDLHMVAAHIQDLFAKLK
jgi:hypothetical protein